MSGMSLEREAGQAFWRRKGEQRGEYACLLDM